MTKENSDKKKIIINLVRKIRNQKNELDIIKNQKDVIKKVKKHYDK